MMAGGPPAAPPAGGLGRVRPLPIQRASVAGPGEGPAAVMPPYLLPAEHFLAGLLWFALGTVGLVAVAPELARGAFLQPRVIAMTHSFTLGWITTCIFGALHQVYPVALGVGARSHRLGHAGFWILQAGVALLVAGAWLWRPRLLAAGWILLFLAVGVISWNLLAQRRRARRGRRIGLYVTAGHGALGLAMFLVAASVAAFAGWWPAGWPPVDRMGILTAHVHLAAVGFATLTAVGVGSKLLPSFLLSRAQPEWPLRWIGPLVSIGLLALAGNALGAPAWLVVSGGVAVAAGMLLYLWLVAGYFRHRTRRRLELPLAHVGVAHLFLAAATALGLWLLLGEPTGPGGTGVAGTATGARLAAAYGVLGLLGWLSLMVVGVYLKIVPFLTWLRCFSSRAGAPGVPTPKDLTRPAPVWATLLLLPAGTVILAVGVGLGWSGLASAGALTFLAGTAAFLLQALHVARLALRR